MPVPQSGTTIPLPRGESFVVGRVLGRGGMGTVVEATHTPSGRRMALKFLHDELKDHPTIPKRFQREVELATALTSAHVARTFGCERTPDGTTFMIMELLDGRDLCSLIRKERLTPARAARIVAQACEALEEAHARGIVHRDLKPENLFVGKAPDGSDWVKVLDFGISKSLNDDARVPALTRVGTTVGTPEYMAPEQLRGAKDLDGTADVYSLGVVLYETLAGRRPFDSNDYEALVRKICSESPAPLGQLRPDCPPALTAIVERAMARDRRGRFGTARLLREALEPLATGRRTEGTLVMDALEGAPSQPLPRSSPTAPIAPPPASAVAPPPIVPAPPRAGASRTEEHESEGSRWGLVVALTLVVVLLAVGAVILLLPMVRQM